MRSAVRSAGRRPARRAAGRPRRPAAGRPACACPAPSTPPGGPGAGCGARRGRPGRLERRARRCAGRATSVHAEPLGRPTATARRRLSAMLPIDAGVEEVDERDALGGDAEHRGAQQGALGPRRGAAWTRSSCSGTRCAARRRRPRAAATSPASLYSSWLTTLSACTAATWLGWMIVLPVRPFARSSTISRIRPSRSRAISLRAQRRRSDVLGERALPQQRLEHPLAAGEVLPDRAGDDEAGAVARGRAC